MSRLPNVSLQPYSGRWDLAAGVQDYYARKAREQAAALHSQDIAQQGNIDAALQQQRMAGQSNLSYQEAVQNSAIAQQHAANQSAMMAQQAGHDQDSMVQKTNLEAQLNAVQLTQSEQMRLQRIRNGMADVNANSNLSDEEKRDLIMQMQTGLNPLEHRRDRANILHTQIQTQAAQQQMMQQAQLFHQHQSFLGSRLQDRLQMVTDPNTGATQAFYMDERGNPTALDFAQNQEMHQMNIARMGQSMGITAAMAPGQLEAQQLQNQGLQRTNTFNQAADPFRLAELRENVNNAATMNPLRARALEGTIAEQQQHVRDMIQQYGIRGQRAPVDLEQAGVDLAASRQRLNLNTALGPIQFQHAAASLDALTESNRHNALNNPTVRNENVARLNLLTQSFDQHQQLFPSEVERAKASVEVLNQQLKQGRALNPSTIREAQLRVQQLEQRVNEGVSPDMQVALLRHVSSAVSNEERNPNSPFARSIRNKTPAEQDQLRDAEIRTRYNRLRNQIRPQVQGRPVAGEDRTPAGLRNAMGGNVGGAAGAPSPMGLSNNPDPAFLSARQTARRAAFEQAVQHYMSAGRLSRADAERVVSQLPYEINNRVEPQYRTR